MSVSSGSTSLFCHSKIEGGVGAIGPASIHSKIRTLLIGTGSTATKVVAELQSDNRRIVIGVVDAPHHLRTTAASCIVPLLGTTDDLGNIIVEHCVDELQVALPLDISVARFPAIHSIAKAFGIPVALRLELLDGAQPSRVEVGSAIASLAYNHHLSSRGLHCFLKRTVDIAVSAPLLVLLSPLFALIALAVKLTSPGPVFFKQPRVGIRRREFKMWKFRTMVKNAEQLRKGLAGLNNARGASFKIVRDPRLTPIGEFLRRTSLDELPQFINVLLGEMSLTGPRPIPLWVADQLQDTTYYRRFHVMPGLTGWWQIQGREQDFEVMARQDLYYVDNWSLSLDFRILIGTIPAVLKGYGAH